MGVSRTVAEPDFMTIISPVITVPNEWTKFTFDLSSQQGNIFIGIHMVSVDSWFLMIDDIQVTGNGSGDLIPPFTSCYLDGTMNGSYYTSDVQITLSATDNISGVNYTMYKIDNSSFQKYTVPFSITNDGEHAITYYSVDNFGNIEQPKNTTFTVKHTISILDIKGGLGLTVTIKNNGDTAAGIIFILKASGFAFPQEKSKIVNILPGIEVREKNLIFGLGKTIFTVTAGGSSRTETGFVILFFIFGINHTPN